MSDNLETIRDAFYEVAGCGDIRFSHDIDRASEEFKTALASLKQVVEAARRVTQYDLSAMPHDTYGYRLIPQEDAERFAADLDALRAALASPEARGGAA